jgi:hypothetical protein
MIQQLMKKLGNGMDLSEIFFQYCHFTDAQFSSIIEKMAGFQGASFDQCNNEDDYPMTCEAMKLLLLQERCEISSLQFTCHDNNDLLSLSQVCMNAACLKTIKLCCYSHCEDPGVFLINLPPNIQHLHTDFLHSDHFFKYAKRTPQPPLVNALITYTYRNVEGSRKFGTEDQLLQLLISYPNVVDLQGELELSPLVVYSLSMNKFRPFMSREPPIQLSL